MQRFANALSDQGIRADGKTESFASSTIRRYYVVLQSILHNAYSLDLIGSNPADSGKIKLPSMDAPKTDIFTKQEVEQLLNYLDSEPVMYQVLIHLALSTGCRRGELVALKWSDMDLDKCIITVCKSNYKIKGEDIKTKETKTRRERVISIPQYCADMLKSFKVEQAKQRLALGDQWINEDWIFTQWNGKAMYPTTPTLWFNKFLKRHNLPHRKFHALRHTSATLLLCSNANIKTVASRLGHAQLSTTNRYVHAVTEADEAAAQALGNIFDLRKKA